MISSSPRSSIVTRTQRMGLAKKPGDRKSTTAGTNSSSSAAPKGTAAAKRAALSEKKGPGNTTSSGGRATTAKDGKKGSVSGTSNATEVKEDEQIKDDEQTAEEEKKFEAANHMEGDLVEMLGNFSSFRKLTILDNCLISSYRARYTAKESKYSLERYC